MPGQNRSLVFSFIFVALVVALYVSLNIYNSSLLNSIADTDVQLTNIEAARDKKIEQDLLALNKKLLVIGSLIDGHIFWSEAFSKIQALVLPQTQFVTLNADTTSRKILIKGYSANYTTMARQIASFYAFEPVTDIILNKVATHPTGRVEFTMQLTFETKKLLNPSLE